MRNLVLFFLALTGLYSCTKPQAIQTNSLSAAFKSYFDYKPGSYWIFYDSANNYFDSVAVGAYTDQQVTTTLTSMEQVQIAMQDYYLDSSGVNLPWSMFLSGNTCSINITQRGYALAGFELAVGQPFQTGTITFNNLQSAQVIMTIAYMPSYNIGSVTYNNVYQVINAFDSYYYTDTFYINQDNGFVAVLLNSQRLFLSRDSIIH
jgi:hypothetical protein